VSREIHGVAHTRREVDEGRAELVDRDVERPEPEPAIPQRSRELAEGTRIQRRLAPRRASSRECTENAQYSRGFHEDERARGRDVVLLEARVRAPDLACLMTADHARVRRVASRNCRVRQRECFRSGERVASEECQVAIHETSDDTRLARPAIDLRRDVLASRDPRGSFDGLDTGSRFGAPRGIRSAEVGEQEPRTKSRSGPLA